MEFFKSKRIHQEVENSLMRLKHKECLNSVFMQGIHIFSMKIKSPNKNNNHIVMLTEKSNKKI